MTLRPYTDQEWLELPHVVLTSDTEWDPTCLDSPGYVKDEIWYDTQSSLTAGPPDKTFDEYRELRDVHEH